MSGSGEGDRRGIRLGGAWCASCSVHSPQNLEGDTCGSDSATGTQELA